jgi:hypothetical protein
VVARIVRLSGRYMGVERNGSEDAMPLARFDWKWGLPYLEFGAAPAMEREFEATVGEHLAMRSGGAPWGWKHPHSYLLLPFLRERNPGMRFIQVIRDGRDVALSANRQQAHHYGKLLRRSAEPERVRAAAWWAWANLRARAEGEALGEDYLLVRFEDLCADPDAWACRIVEFSGGGSVGKLASEVSCPETLGRWRRYDGDSMTEIEAACGGALRRFGYSPPSAP